MLESVAEGGPSGRFSIFGLHPAAAVAWRGNTPSDPFVGLGECCRPWARLEPGCHLPLVGGWIGFLAYEAGRFVEPSAGWRGHDRELPLGHWALYDTLLIHDIAADRWEVAGLTLPPRFRLARPPLETRLDALERFVEQNPLSFRAGPSAGEVSQGRRQAGRRRWNISRDDYLARVERALEYIRAGDIFQVNLARRCRAGVGASPIDLYQRLCNANPAAYSAFLQLPTEVQRGIAPPLRSREGGAIREPGPAILSSSPELFLRVTGSDVTTRPIKGTRPRGATPARDAAAGRALAQSEKDRAELNMIVDLERNDLGRVCEFGTVRVRHEGEIETHPTVFHRTATVVGRLRGDVDAVELLRATFPGGSITGAPKVRAMQIINELERDPRGPYCGAIGYLGLDGDMQLNLAIRTMTVTPGPASGGRRHYEAALSVGSGIVADSSPPDEFDELEAKAAGMIAALEATGMSEFPGLDGDCATQFAGAAASAGE